jgi:hypothetical protein
VDVRSGGTCWQVGCAVGMVQLAVLTVYGGWGRHPNADTNHLVEVSGVGEHKLQ